MHELSLCNSIYRIVDRAAEGRPVSVVHLQVGQLRQVVPDTLIFCWSMVCDATSMSGSRLEIDSVPGKLTCSSCATETVVVETLVLTCGSCGSGDVTVVAGEEFLLTSLELLEA